jgi:hypothetical protein
MKGFLSVCLLVVIFSCNERKPAVVVVKTPPPNPGPRFVYIERTHLNSKTYRVTFKTRFLFPDKLTQDTSFYFEGNFLMLYDKIRNSLDTVALSNMESHPYRLALHDLSDSMRAVVFNIHWIGDSDIQQDEFVSYDGDSLKIMVMPVTDSCAVTDTIFNAG